MQLKDTQVRGAQPADKEYTLRDGKNLFLRITPDGARYWIFRYQYGGKQRQMSLGTYPEVSLKAAREEAAKWRECLPAKDPRVERELERVRTVQATQNTFAAVAQAWLDRNGLKPGEHNDKKWAPRNHDRQESILRRCLLPDLGALPITAIDAPMVLRSLKAAQETRGIATAYEARTTASMVFQFAIASSMGIFSDPARDLKAALDPRPTARNHAALPFEQVGPFLRKLAGSSIAPVTQAAIRLVMLTGMRDKSLRSAQWLDVDLEQGGWFSPKHKNKGRVHRRRDWDTPLPRQALAILEQLRTLTDDGPESYVFASYGKDGYLSMGAINQAVKSIAKELGCEATCHGFRSNLRDWAAENGYSREVAKTQLMQVVGDTTDQAYLRTSFHQQRAGMLQHYADAIEAAEQNLEPVKSRNVRRLRVAN